MTLIVAMAVLIAWLALIAATAVGFETPKWAYETCSMIVLVIWIVEAIRFLLGVL